MEHRAYGTPSEANTDLVADYQVCGDLGAGCCSELEFYNYQFRNNSGLVGWNQKLILVSKLPISIEKGHK